MLTKVKLALRITTDAFDSEIEELIEAAKLDLGIAGVVIPVTTSSTVDAIVSTAIITYCKLYFGEPDPLELKHGRLKKSYDEQKAQLSMATGYTVWTEAQ